MKSQGNRGLEEEVEDLGQEFFHVRLGTAEKPETFEVIELSHTGDRVFERFQIKLNDFLNAHFAAVGKELPGGKHINLNAKYEVS